MAERNGTIHERHRTAFRDNGFVALDEPVLTGAELDEIRALVVPLLDRAGDLGERVTDLAVGDDTGGRIVEINETTTIEPALRRTTAFRRCRRLARDLLQTPMAPYFDHLIAKPPHNLSETPWHQDAAYSPTLEWPPAAHFWIPLQDVTIDNGCMWFVPRSHRTIVEHRPRGGDPSAAGLEAVDVDVTSAVACPLPAGGMTVHAPGTLHRTGPNRSDDPRVAWILHYREEGSWGVRSRVPRPLRMLRNRVLRRG